MYTVNDATLKRDKIQIMIYLQYRKPEKKSIYDQNQLDANGYISIKNRDALHSNFRLLDASIVENFHHYQIHNASY